MILKVKFKANYPSEGIRTMRLAEVIRQETPDGRDTHAVFESEAFKENETLCEGFFLPETNAEVLTPEMQNLLDGMETIELPSNLRSLRPGTFLGCPSFVSLAWPVGIKEIPDYCFKGCTGLKKFGSPQYDDKIHEPSYDGRGIFQVRNNKSLVFPEWIDSIPEGCFAGCTSLKEVIIPDLIKNIGKGAFAGCSSLTQIQISDEISEIPEMCFMACTSLEEINIPISVKKIGDKAFMGCNKLGGFHLPDGVDTIPAGCFYGCSALKEIRLPDYVRTISGYWYEDVGAFQKCTSLTKVYLPDGIELIPRACFKDCLALQEIRIPDSVKELGLEAFENCNSLSNINLPKRLKSIPPGCFAGCTNLSEIKIPDSVKALEEVWQHETGAFQNCSSLVMVHIPEGTKLIPIQCFKDCKALREVRIPDSVKKIGESAFEDCQQLVNLVIPGGVLELHDRCFSGCISLEQIQIPDSVVLIGKNIFDNCTNLKKVTLPIRLKPSIKDLFIGNSKPESIEFKQGITTIVDQGLLISNDGVLLRSTKDMPKELVIPSTVRVISRKAFEDFYPKKVVIRHPVEIQKGALRLIKHVQVLDEAYQTNMFPRYIEASDLEILTADGIILGKFPFLDKLPWDFCPPAPFSQVTSPKTFDEYIFRVPSVYLEDAKLTRIIISIERLSFPFELVDEARQKYIAYLKVNKLVAINWLYQQNRLEDFRKFATYLITKSNFDEVYEMASKKNNTELNAFLLEFKRKILKLDQSTSKPLELKPVIPNNPNSFREVQKLWKLTNLSAAELTLSGYKGAPQTTLSLPPLAGDKPIIRIASESKISAPELIIPEGYKVIDSYAFSKKCNAEKIIMTDSVTTIGNHAFSFCKKLREIRLSDRVSRIEEETFRGCLALTKIDLPQNLVYIGPSAFSRCLKLQRLDLSEKVIEIGDDAFNNCPKLVIHAPKKSYPIEYARDNGIKYVEV